MPAPEYKIYRNLPDNRYYGQYISDEELTPEEWHEITGLASVEGVTYGLVNAGMFTGNDLYAYQEWLFDSRRLYTGLCGYLSNWESGGGEADAPDCFMYGLGGWCLGETTEDCGLNADNAELAKNLLYKFNNKLGASFCYEPDDDTNFNYVDAPCLRGRQCDGYGIPGCNYFEYTSMIYTETCIPDPSQVDYDKPFSNASGWPGLDESYCDDDWRVIPTVSVNYGADEISVMQYHPFTSTEYLASSAPNVVNLYFNLAKNQGFYDINYLPDDTWTDSNGGFGVQCAEDSTEGLNLGYCGGYGFNYETNQYDGSVYYMVTTWDYNKSTPALDNGFLIPNNVSELDYQQVINNTFDVKEVSGKSQMLSHQYNSPGLKEIRVLAFSLHEDGYINLLKRIKIRIFLGLDNVYIEDFSDLGGPDFVFIPWPHSNIPVIGGIARNTEIPLYNTKTSKYVKSLLKIIKSNYFDDDDQLNRAFTQQSLLNDEMGVWPGRLDIQQTRVFKDGTFDMGKLLMIQDGYEDVISIKGTHTFHPYSDSFHWDGHINYFPEETCVGQLFINDNLDIEKRNKCIIELNGGEFEGTYIRDSSGNNNKGILIGDYKITKTSPGTPLIRDSVIDLPTFKTEKGAF